MRNLTDAVKACRNGTKNVDQMLFPIAIVSPLYFLFKPL